VTLPQKPSTLPLGSGCLVGHRDWVVWIGAVMLLAACSDKRHSGTLANGGSAGADAGSLEAGQGGSEQAGGSEAGGGGSGTGKAGAGGSAGAVASGGSATAAPDCSGEFQQPTLALEESPNQLSSVGVSADGLELFYVSVGTGPGQFMHSVRDTIDAMFPPGTPVAELNLVCPDQPQLFSDLTDDGLRAYFSCTRGYDTASPLRYAQRADRGAKFEVAMQTIGQVGTSVSIDQSELTAFSSSYAPYPGPPRQYSRATLDADFGADGDVPGLESVTMSTPDLSSDGLTLYGASNGSIIAAHRPTLDAPFAPPETLFASDGTTNYGSPTITADCRALYFVRVTSGAAGTWRIVVARR
jgi:hypothetical protein